MREASTTSAPCFRIISANLWNGGADPDAFAALVEKLDADAVAVQELTPPQAEALARVRPHGRLEPNYFYNGMGIALRAPAPMRHLPMPIRDAHIADVALTASDGALVRVELINIHVRAPHSPPSWGTMVGRRGQWRGLQRHLVAAPNLPRVVVGDFNATPSWPLYRRVAAHLRDAAVEAAARDGGRTKRTWGPWPWTPRLLRIDHAFVHRVAVRDFRVVDVVGADHSAIVVDIAVK
jgi:endonuclease/exonuclease/phosphatase family metal-dependent hydrolase